MTPAAVLSIDASNDALQQALEAALSAPVTASATPIGLIGCGWIGGLQLEAYAAAGFHVVALCDRNPGRAEEYRQRYVPDARAYDDLDDLLHHPGLAVVDVATHVRARAETIERCIEAGFDVLSQKPFVEDLAAGERLARAARTRGVTLAVNQNGRWAPHFGAMLAVVASGTIGDVVSADFSVAWPHDQIIEGMEAFENMPDLILFDFGAHWFDLIGVLAPTESLTARAVVMRRPGQTISAPLQASAIVSGEGFIASANFRAGERYAEYGAFRVSGTRGVVNHVGRSLGGTSVQVESIGGTASIVVSDDWFAHGLAGAMGALLRARAASEPPTHSPESALRGLAIAFAASASARSGTAVEVGSARSRYGD